MNIRLPSREDGLDQDEEYLELTDEDGETRRIRFHDYAEIFAVPGLYEQLFADELECNSPRVVVDLLDKQLREGGSGDPANLRVLDFGAGNGMVGEELARIGAGKIIGVDLLEEAKTAAERDRPGVYDDYFAEDMTELTPGARAELVTHSFNVLTCVAALGFGDIPAQAFATALNLLEDPAWLAFNIRQRFTEDGDESGFGGLLERMLDEGILKELARERYIHRRSVSGEELPYLAIVAEKQSDIPLGWLD